MAARLLVSVPDQTLRLLAGDGRVLREYPVSTARNGLGTVEGSGCTPTGQFVIARKIGHGAESGTIFRSREPVGLWQGEPAGEDHVLTRILWLDGTEAHNANTFQRYIYIHGTNQEHLIGQPVSHGCVRMTNADMIDLFDQVEAGDTVEILGQPERENGPPEPEFPRL